LEKEKKEKGKGNIEVSKNFNFGVISNTINVFKAIVQTFLLF